MLMSTETDVWTDVHQERQVLLELLETLTPEQWDARSLCAEWRVRDVVGHMVSETRMTVAQVAWGFITSGRRINRHIAKDARQRGAAPVAKLLEEFRNVVFARTHLPGLSSLSMLEDIVIHQMDIRRPLEQQRCIPNNRMIPVARDLWTNRFFPGPKLFQGVRASATDADWSVGDGLEVAGPIEALVLTLAGRFAALDQLQGDGAAILRMRVDGLRGQ
ncbi:MAG TPA: maleylpyruvate isomerase family mycothiol-dependent enzyme [Isosphaeraceae bacterium]|nr:maleylpyruvate isomerase family mycothiol-dependent enzyme [Isosphaeraceae bacterium]